MEPRTPPDPKASGTILLTPEMVCKVLSISRRTLRSWIQKKVFPQPLRIGPDGRILRWHPADLVDYLARTRGRVSAAEVQRQFPAELGKE
jgi:predicted DNA-binding transcriptional regulator AlpA